MTSPRRKRAKRTVVLTFGDFEDMCLNHSLEYDDAQAFWRMALRKQKKAGPQ